MKKLWRKLIEPLQLFWLQCHYETQVDEYEPSESLIDKDGSLIQRDGKFVAHIDGVTACKNSEKKIVIVFKSGKVEYKD
jgi:hypothetical protein